MEVMGNNGACQIHQGGLGSGNESAERCKVVDIVGQVESILEHPTSQWWWICKILIYRIL